MEESLQSFLKCIFKVASEDRVGFKTGQCDDMCYACDCGSYPRDMGTLEVLGWENNRNGWELGNPSGRKGLVEESLNT